MRLFFAVNFDDDTKNRIISVQGQLRRQSSSGNFTRPQNLHLTLAFLGETPEGILPGLSSLLSKIPRPYCEIEFNRTGCFTHSRKELWWIGADPACPGLRILEKIHSQLFGLLMDENISFDTRPFMAHITLGRDIKKSGAITLDFPGISIPIHRISLMKSEQIHGVLTYTELCSN